MPPPPGDCSFTPSELLSFLRLKIAGEPLPATAAAHFHDADIYTAEPAQLTTLFDPAPAKKGEGSSSSWFFFTHVRPKSSSDSRKSRLVAGGVGTWHSERAPRRVLDDEGDCAGHSQYFSYKLKIGKNCSERTEWYMLEFSDGQEADHERVHGGEPQLVLCNVYKAHTHSRSSNGSTSTPSSSASARKRKAVGEASAPPVKARRQLFYSSAPASAAKSQEQVRPLLPPSGQSDTLDCIALMTKADGKATTSQLKIGDTSVFSRFWPEPEKSTSDCIALMSKAEGEGEATTSQLKIGDTPDFSRFWPEPEKSFDGGYTTTGGALPTLENCSRTNVRDVVDVFCGQDAWPSAFHSNNDTTTFVCGMPSAPVLQPPAFVCGMPSAPVLPPPAFVCGMLSAPVLPPPAFVCGMPSAPVLQPPAFVCGMPSAPVLPPPAFVCSMPSAPALPPPGEASWWCGSHDVQSY